MLDVRSHRRVISGAVVGFGYTLSCVCCCFDQSDFFFQGVVEYRINWCGYSVDFDTWETEKALAGTRILQNWRAENPYVNGLMIFLIY
jgi:hypothetical protein